MTLTYANGPGFKNSRDGAKRMDPRKLDKENIHFLNPATVPRVDETHGGDDVAVYARGPWAHLFKGSFEQNAIPYILAYAACIGDGPCAKNN